MGKRTHGHAKRGAPSKTYQSWRAMHKRCYLATYRWYFNHGGRGIRVHPDWHEFETFLADMGVCPPGLTLERVENSEHYGPLNCVWDTPAAQARNRRNTRLIEFRGEKLCLKDWADRFGLEQSRLSRRLGMMDMERAVTLPVRKYERKRE